MDPLDRRTATLQTAPGSARHLSLARLAAHTGADEARIDAPAELEYVQHEGILPMVLRELLHPAGAA